MLRKENCGAFELRKINAYTQCLLVFCKQIYKHNDYTSSISHNLIYAVKRNEPMIFINYNDFDVNEVLLYICQSKHFVFFLSDYVKREKKSHTTENKVKLL